MEEEGIEAIIGVLKRYKESDSITKCVPEVLKKLKSNTTNSKAIKRILGGYPTLKEYYKELFGINIFFLISVLVLVIALLFYSFK